MSNIKWVKDPNASLRYGFDVAGTLATGDTLTGVSISAQAGVTAASAEYSGTQVWCRVTGGAAGVNGSVTLRWTTAAGDTDERTILFVVQER